MHSNTLRKNISIFIIFFYVWEVIFSSALMAQRSINDIKEESIHRAYVSHKSHVSDSQEVFVIPVQQSKNDTYSLNFDPALLQKNYSFYLVDDQKSVGFVSTGQDHFVFRGLGNNKFHFNGEVNNSNVSIYTEGKLKISAEIGQASRVELQSNGLKLNNKIHGKDNVHLRSKTDIKLGNAAQVTAPYIMLDGVNCHNDGSITANQGLYLHLSGNIENTAKLHADKEILLESSKFFNKKNLFAGEIFHFKVGNFQNHGDVQSERDIRGLIKNISSYQDATFQNLGSFRTKRNFSLETINYENEVGASVFAGGVQQINTNQFMDAGLTYVGQLSLINGSTVSFCNGHRFFGERLVVKASNSLEVFEKSRLDCSNFLSLHSRGNIDICSDVAKKAEILINTENKFPYQEYYVNRYASKKNNSEYKIKADKEDRYSADYRTLRDQFKFEQDPSYDFAFKAYSDGLFIKAEGDLNQNGKVKSNVSSVDCQAGSKFMCTGEVKAGVFSFNHNSIKASQAENQGTFQSSGWMNIDIEKKFGNHGQILAQNLMLKALSFKNTQSIKWDHLAVIATQEESKNLGKMEGGTAFCKAENFENFGSMAVKDLIFDIRGKWNNVHNIEAQDNLNIRAADADQQGNIIAGSLDIKVKNFNHSGQTKVENAKCHIKEEFNNSGPLEAEKVLAISADTLNNSSILKGETANLNTREFNNETSGILKVVKSLKAATDSANAGTYIHQAVIASNQGTIEAEKATLQIKKLDNSGHLNIAQNGSIQGESLSNSGNIDATNLSVKESHSFYNSGNFNIIESLMLDAYYNTNFGYISAKNALLKGVVVSNLWSLKASNSLSVESDLFTINFLGKMEAKHLSIKSGIANINLFGLLNGHESLSMTASLLNLNLGGIARTSGHYSSTALCDVNLGLIQAFKKTSNSLFSAELGLTLPSLPSLALLSNYDHWYDHQVVGLGQMAVNNFAPAGIASLVNLGMTALRIPTMLIRAKTLGEALISEKPMCKEELLNTLTDLAKLGISIFEMTKGTVNNIENFEHIAGDTASWTQCPTPDFSQFAHNVGSSFLSPSIVQNSLFSLNEGLTISGNITHNQLFEITGGVTIADSYSDRTMGGLTNGHMIVNQYHLEAFKDYEWSGKGIFNKASIKAGEHLDIKNASLNAQQLAITSEDVLDLKNSHISGSSETLIKGKKIKKLEGNEFKGGHITFDIENSEEGVESVIAVVDGSSNLKADLLMSNVDWVNDQDRHFKHHDLGLAFHSVQNRKNIEADGELRLYGETHFKNETNGSIRAQNGLTTGTQGQHLNLGLLSGGKGDNYVFGNTIESYITTEKQTPKSQKKVHGIPGGFFPHFPHTTHKEIRHTPQYTGRNVIQIANAGISHRGTEITALENAYLKSKSRDITLNPYEYNRQTQYDSIHVWDSVKIAAGSNIFIQTPGHLNAPVLHATAGENIVLDASAGMNLDGRATTYIADKGSRKSGSGPWKKKHKWEREEAVFYQTQLHAGGELHLKTDQGTASASAAKLFANGEITVDALHDLNLGAAVAKTHSYDKKDSWRKNKTIHNSETQADVMVASSNKSIEMRARDGLITSLGGILVAPHVGLFGNKGIDWNAVPLEKCSQTNENWFSLDIGAGSVGTTYHQSEIEQHISFAQQGIILADQLDIVTGEGTTANFQGTNLKGFSGDKIKELFVETDTLLLGGTPIEATADARNWSVGAGFNFVTRVPTFSASYGEGHNSQLTYQQANVEVDHMTIKREGTKIKITDGIKGNIDATSGALFDLEVDNKQTVEKEKDFSAGVSFTGNNQIAINAGYSQTEKKTSDVTDFTIGDAPNLRHRVDIHHKDSETHVGAEINLSASSDLSNVTGGVTLQRGNQKIGFDVENIDKISKLFDNISNFDLNSVFSKIEKELDFNSINSLSDFTQAVSNAASKGHDLLEEISKVSNFLKGAGIDLKGFDKKLSQVEGTLDKIAQINKGVRFLESLPEQLTHTLDDVTKSLHNFSKPESFSDVTKHLGEAIAQGQALSDKVETISQILKGFGVNVSQLDQSINKAKDILIKISKLQTKLDNGSKLIDKVYKNSPHNLSQLENSIKKTLPNLENFNLANVHNLSDFVHIVGTTIDHAKGMLTQVTELNKQLEEIGIHNPHMSQSLSKATKQLDKAAAIQSNVEYGTKAVEKIEKDLPQTLEKIGDELNKGFSNLMHLKFEGIHSFDDISQLFGNAITKSHTLLDNLRNLNNALTENGINVNEFATSLNKFEKVLKNAEDIQVKIGTSVQLVEQVSESLSKSLEALNKDIKKELPSFDEFKLTGIDSVTQSIDKIGNALANGRKWITKTKEFNQKFHDLGIASPTIDHSLNRVEKFLDNTTEIQENAEKRIEAFKQFSDELTMVIGEFGRSLSNQLDIKAFKFDDIHSMMDFTHKFGQVLHKEQDWVVIVSHLNDFLHDMGIQSSGTNQSIEQVKHILDKASQVKSDVETQLKIFEKVSDEFRK